MTETWAGGGDAFTTALDFPHPARPNAASGNTETSTAVRLFIQGRVPPQTDAAVARRDAADDDPLTDEQTAVPANQNVYFRPSCTWRMDVVVLEITPKP